MKQAFESFTPLMKMIKDRWGLEPKGYVDGGSKYGGQNDDDHIHNPILGPTTVREVKQAELFGAIVWQFDSWRVAAEKSISTVTGAPCSKVSSLFLEWRHVSQSVKDDLTRRQLLITEAIIGLNV